MTEVTIDAPLTWGQVAAIAEGADLRLGKAALARIAHAQNIVRAIVAKNIHAYGVNTGVGALCDTIIGRDAQAALSRNLVMSHACGVGAPFGPAETRAIVAAQINNFAHGRSGVRPAVVEMLADLLAKQCVPEVPSRGSVGYLTAMAHIALVLIGEGRAEVEGSPCSGAEALARIGRAPLALEAKEGLSLVNGTPCATGLGALALRRAARLLDWADGIAAMTFENLRGQIAAFGEDSLALRVSPGLRHVGERLRGLLAGSRMIADGVGRRTQDALSLRAVPHVHGAARDAFADAARAVDDELASVTDNPAIAGTPEAPRVFSEAHAVGARLALAMDALKTAVAEVAAMAERRLDRLINPLVSGLPPFLAEDGGARTGFMIAHYTAVALVAENRRLAAPASLDGGVTSAMQEDHLVHATAAAAQALTILDNAQTVLAIEALADAQAYDLQQSDGRRARGTEALYRALRARLPLYRDDRPIAGDIAIARRMTDEDLVS